MTLKVVEPINITEAVLTASDIPEPDASVGEVEWEQNRNGASYEVNANSSAIASSSSVDYVISFTGSATMSEYTNGALSYSKALAEIDFFPSDSHYYDGVIYIADLTTIKSYNTSTKVEGEIVISGGVESGAVFTSITSVLNVFYLYDRFNKKIKVYNLSGNTLTYQSEILVDIGDGYPKLTTANDGGFFVLNLGVISTYSDQFNLISEQEVPRLNHQSEAYGGISNNGLEIRGISTIYNTVESYDYSFSYKGLYKAGERVIKTSTHNLYQCLVDTTQDPEVGATEDSTATWIVVGPTNKWAMFDDQNSTTTKSSGSFSVELESSDYIMAYGVTGSSGLTSVRCQVYDSGSNLIYDDTQSAFDNVGAPGDFIYASEDVFYKKKLYQTDIPPTENFKAVFTFNGSDIEIGNLTVGPAIELGPCLSDSKNESLDLSEQVFDDFGNETYTERPIITFATYETISSIESSNITNRFLNVIRRKGCLWIGEVGCNQSIVTFGRIERDPIPYTMPTEIRYTIRVRGFA